MKGDCLSLINTFVVLHKNRSIKLWKSYKNSKNQDFLQESACNF